MFSFFNQQAPIDTGSSSSDDDNEHAKIKEVAPTRGSIEDTPTSTISEKNVTMELNEDTDDMDVIPSALIEQQVTLLSDAPAVDSSFMLKLQAMEERNKKMTKQLSVLQGIITSKSSLYLEYKRKFEVSIN
jgi:hypothetical protein